MAEQPAPARSGGIGVEVVYCAGRTNVDCTPLLLAAGSTVADALHASGVLRRIDAAGAARHGVGIWGRAVPMDRQLQDGDRIEIYRPLRVDPKQARRLRQQHQQHDATRRGARR